MKRSNKKKGFTLVELIVVIAILAILATVSIVGYVSFIKKTNQSVDEQFVTQLNNVLQAEEASGKKPANIKAVQDLLKENNVNSFVATNSENELYWVGSENRVVLWSIKSNKVVFPKDMAKKYSDVTDPSKDWSRLDVEAEVKKLEDGVNAQGVIDAFKAIGAGDTNVIVQLPKDAEVSFDKTQALSLRDALKGKQTKLDLNGGKILTSYKILVQNNAVLEITNGKLESSSNYGITIDYSSSVVLRNVDVSVAGYYGICVYETSEIVLDGCNISSKTGMGIAMNNTISSNVKITVKNSTIEAPSAILMNSPGSYLRIENSNLVGQYHGLIARLGTAVVSNSTIKVTSSSAMWGKDDLSCDNYNYYDKDGNNHKTYWSTGTQLPAAALVVGDYSNGGNSYVGLKSVTLNNVTVVSEHEDKIPAVLLSSTPKSEVVLNYDSTSKVGATVVYAPDGGYTTRLPMTVNGEAKN